MSSTTFSGPVTSTNGFVGAVTGAITGNVTGNLIGNITSAAGLNILTSATVASAVNYVTATNAIANAAPFVSATGSDTNIALLLKGKGTGAVQLGQATSVGVTLIADQPILDSSANELIKFTKAATAVNEITVANAATGSGPSIAATGGDTNVAVLLAGKGTGAVQLGQATSVGVTLIADQPILDSSANELIKFTKAATAVNEITIANAATTAMPVISATGGDTNISLKLTPKGTGQTVFTLGGPIALTTVTPDTTAGVVTYTAAQLLGGLLLRDPNGAGRSDVTPAASLLVAAIPGAVVGSSFEFTIRNDADAAETITVTAGAGATLSGTMTIEQLYMKRFLVVLTNVTASAEAYTAYSLGTVVF